MYRILSGYQLSKLTAAIRRTRDQSVLTQAARMQLQHVETPRKLRKRREIAISDLL